MCLPFVSLTDADKMVDVPQVKLGDAAADGVARKLSL